MSLGIYRVNYCPYLTNSIINFHIFQSHWASHLPRRSLNLPMCSPPCRCHSRHLMALTAIIYNRVMWGEELDDSSGTLVFGKFVWGKQCRVYHPQSSPSLWESVTPPGPQKYVVFLFFKYFLFFSTSLII